MRLHHITLIPAMLAILLPTATSAASNLSVPFTSQAPTGDWIEPWQNACEESSILMIDAFYRNYTLDSNNAPNAILDVFAIKHAHYGESLDENARKVVSIINNFFPWEAYVAEDPTLDDIKKEIDARRPVIMTAHGKALRNPRFQAGGPIYHVYVISGYDDDTQEFIVQEPGTSHGHNARYSYETVMNAMHDFLPNNETPNGPKRAVFTSNTVEKTRLFDADQDGLTKEEEITHGTSLSSSDTEGDGFSDGIEIAQGFSPLVDENSILETGGLIKSAADPKVYLLRGHVKRHIYDEETFLANKWKWQDIITVSDRFLASIVTGDHIRK